MSRSLRNTIALTSLSISMVSASAASAGQLPLFADSAATAAARLDTDPVVTDLASQRSTRQVQIVTAAATQIDTTTQRLYLNLSPGLPLLVDQMSAYRNDDRTVVWNGLVGGTDAAAARMQRKGPQESVEDPRNTATIVRNGNNLTGSVRVDGRLYRIEPIGRGRHAVIEVDEAALPPDDGASAIPLSDDARMLAAEADTVAGTSVDANAAAPIDTRVLVVITRQAANTMADPRGFAQSLVAEANQSYSGSRVNLRLRLADVRVTNYTEYSDSRFGPASGVSMSNDLTRFRGNNDGYMDDVHAARNGLSADLMMLVRRDNNDACGTASEILASAATAFAVMSRTCGPGRYTFHHEIGHLQGARHNPSEDPSTLPFAFGHGIVARPGRFSTVMSYPPGNGSAPRVMWFSNPDLFLEGVRMGTAATQDNARVLNQTRARVANFR